MKLLLAKIGNQIALLLAVAWLITNPSWEPGILTTTLFFAWLGMEILPSRKLSDHDIELINELKEMLPSDGESMILLKEHDFGDEFQSASLRQLDKFMYAWHNAEHEFNNRQLEEQKDKLLQACKNFRNKLAKHVSGLGHGYLSMHMEDFETRPKVLRAREEINRLATDAFKEHQVLVRIGRHLKSRS